MSCGIKRCGWWVAVAQTHTRSCRPSSLVTKPWRKMLLLPRRLWLTAPESLRSRRTLSRSRWDEERLAGRGLGHKRMCSS